MKHRVLAETHAILQSKTDNRISMLLLKNKPLIMQLNNMHNQFTSTYLKDVHKCKMLMVNVM
ncbi:hypothetical protein AFK63_05245 [Cronobacter muytjensii ATCC 51329]|nr:hypothetical protein AFK63_05245 [Cronobacter muytjensii ATCC 51329]